MINYDKESAFQAGTRTMIEREIEDSRIKGDTHQMDAKLDIHPYGRDRMDISLEAAHDIARKAIAISSRKSIL